MFTLHISVHYSLVYKFICILIVMILLIHLPEIIIQKSTFSHYFSFILCIFQDTSPFVLCILQGTFFPYYVYSPKYVFPFICEFSKVLFPSFFFVFADVPYTFVYFYMYYIPLSCIFCQAVFPLLCVLF